MFIEAACVTSVCIAIAVAPISAPYAAGYSASKFGLKGFTEALKGELIKWPHIHVCDLFPAFLDTPGIQHAANYTGHVLRPAPPVYDPQRVARRMVSVAMHPKKSVTVGSIASLLHIAHLLVPGISRFITAKVIEQYLKKADAMPVTYGNLFTPLEYGTSIHGGWNTAADASSRKKTAMAAGFIAALIVAFTITAGKKD